MVNRKRAVLSSMLGMAFAAVATTATTADKKSTPPKTQMARTPAAVATKVKPNLSVGAVWIGSGTGDRFAVLGRNPRQGETVSLVCRVDVMGSPPPGWRMAWFIDGVKTCGEGHFAVTQPDCQFPWPMSTGIEVFIDHVPHATGSHTFMCVVDTGGDVKETSETDNAKRVSFTVVPPLKAILQQTVPVTRAPIGPSLRRLH